MSDDMEGGQIIYTWPCTASWKNQLGGVFVVGLSMSVAYSRTHERVIRNAQMLLADFTRFGSVEIPMISPNMG